jgi:PAS domain S-box-containing protein
VEPSSIDVLIPLVGALACALCAALIWLQDSNHPSNRAAISLVGGAAWWCACQVLWTAGTPASEAAVWHRLGSLGWAFIGPLALQLVLSVVPHAPRRVVRALPVLFAIAAFHAGVRIFTPWMHADPVPGPYGWWFEPQPYFNVHLAFTYACVVPAIVLALRSVRHAPSPAERNQVRVIAAGIAAPMLLASVTSAFLPAFGIPAPPLGGASFALLGAAVAWSYRRYGFSALVPGSFSREILATLADGVGLVGLDGRLLSGNGALAQLLGVEAAELAGLDIDRRIDASIVAERSRAVECELEQLTGQWIPVAISSSRLHDKRGLVVGVVVVVHDLREVVGLRRHLVTSGRLAAVGELAAGIAHEINNPMAFVRANLTQLRSAWEELGKHLPREAAEPARMLHDEMFELLDDSIEGVERTTSIVRDVRSFAHGGNGERESVDLNELLEQVLRIAAPQLRHRANLVRTFEKVPPVWAAAQELKQVFLNLVVNAGQALESEGTVEVTTRRTRDGVAVTVRDDGCGIPAEHQDRIFDPFFTTKPVGEGTGLGLAISHQILRAHGAEIQLTSEPEMGTTFTVHLPIAGGLPGSLEGVGGADG